jgi:hypothetical protein
MALPLHTVILRFPPSHLPTMVTRLTTHLLQRRYDFLQTCYDTTHSDFDIFQGRQPLVRLTLRSAHPLEAPSEPMVLATPPALTADALGIIQHLLQT